MRMLPICVVALSLVWLQCSDGGKKSERDVLAGDVADAAGGGGDVVPAADVPEGVDGPGRDVKPTPDDADGGPGPDVPEGRDGGPDGDIHVDPPECETDADCEHLEGPCTEATCSAQQVCEVAPRDCSDGDDCTFDVCNETTDLCEHSPNPECGCLSDADCPEDTDVCRKAHCEIPAGAQFGTCEFVAETVGCDDNNPCTEAEACTAVAGPRVAVCGGGNARSCDDADEATTDWCDPADRDGDPCQHRELVPCPNGQGDCLPGSACVQFTCDDDAVNPLCRPTDRTGSCDDGNFCTDGDTCQGGACVGGAPHDCDDGDLTTCDTCLPVEGRCENTVCTTAVCVTAQDCRNQLPAPPSCRQWLCPQGFCRDVRVPEETSCEDGQFCTVGDSCRAGECQAGLPNDCDDGNALSPDTCDEDQDVCLHGEVYDCGTGCQTGSDCSDGDPCTTDACLTFLTPTVCTCTPRPACHCDPAAPDAATACDDGVDITVDSCIAADDERTPPDWPYPGYCLHEIELVCDEPCTGADDDAACDDGDKCTFDTCEFFDPDEGTWCCTHPVQGPPTCQACEEDADCADGNLCTPDHCGADGRCDPPGPPEPGCEICRADEDCLEDTDLCTTAFCNRVTGECGFRFNTTGCDDGDVCTQNDVCSEGVCAGEPRDCDDGNECTVDTCDAEDGCVQALVDPLPEACLDCRTNPLICQDYNECTLDSCGASGTCLNEDLSAGDTPLCQPVPCRDESDCDDGNPCTNDRCAPALPDPDGDGPIAPVGGCIYTADLICTVPDGLRCTTAADCDLADCQPDSPAAFCNNPADECPETYCDAQLGCRHLPTVACPFGECTPATGWDDCWDQQPCTVDECDPETFDCVPIDERRSAHPADSLYTLCYPCEVAADCPAEGIFDLDDPCITVECLKPLLSPDDAGVCYAHVDQALYPNRCEDYDLCTLDACLEGGGCSHTERNATCQLCTTNGDCDDVNECTIDTCDFIADSGAGFSCTHAPIAGCIPCHEHADCPGQGGTFCDDSLCIGGLCTDAQFGDDPHVGPVCAAAAGCTTPADCGSDAGVTAFCTPGGDCLLLPDSSAPGFQCTRIDQCISLTPCQRAIACTAGTCVYETVPGCTPRDCTTWEDCDDGSDCSMDVCTADGQCIGIWADVCCETTTDCVDIFSTDSHCQSMTCGPDGACHLVPFAEAARCGNELCETDADCTGGCDPEFPEQCTTFCFGEECYNWPCAKAACNAFGRCVWFDGDCAECDDDTDCLDPLQCTEDRCVEGACTHTPDPDCEPEACDADMPCDSGDPCVIGMCLSGTCLWMTSPLCD